MKRLDAILIAGPTASGKSALPVEHAERHHCVVVNADSKQVYDALRILTARPPEADTARVEHRLYGHIAASQSYSTGAWYRDAGDVVEELRKSGRMPVFVGGTGLYFRALLGGLSDMPAVPASVRAAWRSRLDALGAKALHGELAAVDPQAAAAIREADGQRIVRALEVFEATGASITALQSRAGQPLVDPGHVQKVLLMPERAELHRRIGRRFAGMIAAGAIEEVRALFAQGLAEDLPVMKAIGVRELQGVIEGKFSVAEAEARAVAATRQYAKRQMTWFRNQLGPDWLALETAEAGW
ncbi:MAG: tRNA (adenosine(37)-N6)-dimethylallyltransferase MiaA [Pararhizobium sp.]